MKFKNQEEALSSVVAEIKANKQLPLNYKHLEEQLGSSFLSYCVHENKPKELRLLLEAGAKMDDSNSGRDSCFYQSVIMGRLECIEILLSFGAEYQKNIYGCGVAWWTTNADTLEFLHQKGVDVNELDQGGRTILISMICGNTKTQEICRIIEKEILNIDFVGSNDLGEVTALMMAVSQRRPEVVKKLIEHGADIYYTNKNGENAFTYALSEIASCQVSGAFRQTTEVYEYLKSIDEKNKLNNSINLVDKDTKNQKI